MEVYDAATTEWQLEFTFKEKIWAIFDSEERPCYSFLNFSQMGKAWIIRATTLPMGRTDRWRRWYLECNANLLIMKCFPSNESKALRSVIRLITTSIFFRLTFSYSTMLNLDVKKFLKYSEKWGPSVSTCIQLTRRRLDREDIRCDTKMAAKKFAEYPTFRR